jgi:glycine/serine hydroxymethyltransferase
MKEAEMIKIGTWIADVLDNIGDESVRARVKAEARNLALQFPVP